MVYTHTQELLHWEELYVVPLLFIWVWCILFQWQTDYSLITTINECLTMVRQHVIVERELDQKSEDLISMSWLCDFTNLTNHSVSLSFYFIIIYTGMTPTLPSLESCCAGQMRSHTLVWYFAVDPRSHGISPSSCSSMKKRLRDNTYCLSQNFIADISVLRNLRNIIVNKLV